MTDVTVTTRIKIEAEKMIAVEVWPKDAKITMKQNFSFIHLDPAAIPALIEALQAAAKETSDE